MEQVAPLGGPAAVVAAVAHGIDAHLDGAAAEDDVTMLCARCSS
jgi:hypothetical protein